MAEPSGRRGVSRVAATVASALFSVLLHGSVFAAALYWIEDRPGAITAPTEAISIEFLETEVLEAVETTAATTAMASLESVQSSPGSTAESAGASSKAAPDLKPVEPSEQVEVKDASVSETSTGVEALEGALETDAPPGVERPDVKANEAPSSERKERKKPVKTAKHTDPTDLRKADSEAKKKGGASSRAAKRSGATGRTSASTGSSINYAALVRARVAARRPAGGGRRGTVVIAFGVTRFGGMSFASIARSSGNPGLDRSVLAAVRSAGPFPAPPPGAGLRFAIPFHFK